MQTCTYCGRENAASAKFCAGCGAPLVGQASASPVPPPPPAYQPQYQPQYQPLPYAPKQNRWIWLIVAGVVVAFLLAICIILTALGILASSKPRTGTIREETPVAIAVPKPTRIAKATLTTRPTAALIPTQSSGEAAFKSGGLGLTKAEWEAAHGAPDSTPNVASGVYEHGKYMVIYWGTDVQYVWTIEKQFQSGEWESESAARAEALAMLPADAVMTRVFPEFQFKSYLYFSPALGKVYRFWEDDFDWGEAAPGTSTVSYEYDKNGHVITWSISPGYFP